MPQDFVHFLTNNTEHWFSLGKFPKYKFPQAPIVRK